MNDIALIIQTIASALSLPHWIALAGVLFTSVTIARRNTKHAQFQREAMRQLKALLKCTTPQEKFYLLRKTNPFVFEEMILTAFKKKGYKIIRNKRYTGDGGIDGKVYIDKKLHLIQAKRYREHINLAHIKEFNEICANKNAYGLFIHTGKTGAQSRQEAINTNLDLISGDKLLNLLNLKSHHIGLNYSAPPPKNLTGNRAAYGAAILAGLTISLYFSSALYFLLNGWDAEQAYPWSIFTYMKYLHAPYGAYLAISLIVPNLIVAAMAAMWFFKPEDRNARWATREDIKEAGLLKKEGLILGQTKKSYLINDDPTHAFIIAPSRSGKGVGLVIPNLLTWRGSFICLDVKGENHRITSGYRHSLNHKVINFCPFDPHKKSHCFNPLDFVSRDTSRRITDLQIMATTIIELGEKSAPHFPIEGRILFVGLALYVLDNDDYPSTIGSIYRLLGTEHNLGELLAHLAQIVPNLDEASKQLFNSFSHKAEKEQSGIQSTLSVALQLWLNPVIDAVTSKSDFDLRELRKRRHAIYLGVAINDLKTLAPLMRILFEQAINALTVYEPDLENEPHKVMLLMDELHTLGKMDVMTNAFTLLAGARVRLLGVVQNLGLLDTAYGSRDIRNTILANSAHIVYFATKDETTQKYVSALCGEKTVKSKSISKGRGFSGEAAKVSISEKVTPLIRTGEVNTFGKNKQIILVEKHHPVKCKKIDYRKGNDFTHMLMPPAPTPDLVITQHSAPKYDLPEKEESEYPKKLGASKSKAQYKHGIKVSNDDGGQPKAPPNEDCSSFV